MDWSNNFTAKSFKIGVDLCLEFTSKHEMVKNLVSSRFQLLSCWCNSSSSIHNIDLMCWFGAIRSSSDNKVYLPFVLQVKSLVQASNLIWSLPKSDLGWKVWSKTAAGALHLTKSSVLVQNSDAQGTGRGPNCGMLNDLIMCLYCCLTWCRGAYCSAWLGACFSVYLGILVFKQLTFWLKLQPRGLLLESSNSWYSSRFLVLPWQQPN